MKQLKFLNILYIFNSLESEPLTYLQSKCNNIFTIENVNEVQNLLINNNYDLLISEKAINSENLIEIRKYSINMHILVVNKTICDSLYFDAINLQGIKFMKNFINRDIFIDELKEVIQTLDSNNSNILYLQNNFIYDTYNNKLLKNSKIVSLSKKEDMFLGYIINNQNRAISYEELNDTLWQGDMTHNALRSVVKEVRKKTYKNLVKNVSGVGYRIEI